MLQSLPARRILLPVILTIALLAAGCLSVPSDPEGEQGAQDAPRPASGGPQDGLAVWKVGDAWRYQVSGSEVRQSGTVTIGVVQADEDAYLLGTDHTGIHQAAVTGTAAPWIGKVDAGTLAPYVDGRPRDLIGIDREPGETWQVRYAGSSFSFVRSESMLIDGSPGHRSAGAAPDGRSIMIEYNEEAGWFTQFTLRDKDDRSLVAFRLLDRLDDPPNMLETWDVLSHHRTIGYDGKIGHERFQSDGSADMVLVMVHVHDDAKVKRSSSSSSSSGGLVGGLLDRASNLLGMSPTQLQASSGSSAGVTVLGPSEERLVDLRGLGPGESVRMYKDEPGLWQLVASTGGPSVEIMVYRVEVVHHIL